MPGSWLMASVCMEWMKQISCATEAVWGSSSLSHNEIQTALSAQFFVFGAFLAGFTCVWGFLEKPRD